MRPLAIIPVYNEADILPAVLRHLEAQGCDVYLLDNWSTDAPLTNVLLMLRNHHDADYELWPESEPKFYDWTGILKRIEEIALEHGRGRWVMLHDADEIRRSPWPDVTLADAFDMVESSGYNAVKFAVRTFIPVDNSWQPGGDPETHFRYYRPDHIDYRNKQIKAWMQPSARVDIHTHAGHEAIFQNRRVFPAPFMLKHYPIRSQEHGERKLRERRYSPAERAKGWHVQYDGLTKFIEDPANLHAEL